MKFNPITAVKARFQRWWQARQPLTDTLTLTQRNVYILPTRVGWMLAVTLLVLLVASINYQLNLGYVLTFMLAGSAAVGMVMGHNTVRGITLHLIAPDAQYMGAGVNFDVKLSSDRRTVRHGIGLGVQGSGHWAWTDVPTQGSSTVRCAFQPTRRGLHHLPVMTIETRFPLGSFRVWSHWRPASQVLVFPAPEAHPPPLPAGEPAGGGSASARTAGTGEFDGVRAYQRGDPLKLVVWKKVARAMARGTDELVSRDSQQAQRNTLWLDYSHTGGLADPEARLSRLCAWVLQAEALALDYGLRLHGGPPVPPGSGHAHQHRCLEALALWGQATIT